MLFLAAEIDFLEQNGVQELWNRVSGPCDVTGCIQTRSTVDSLAFTWSIQVYCPYCPDLLVLYLVILAHQTVIHILDFGREPKSLDSPK